MEGDRLENGLFPFISFFLLLYGTNVDMRSMIDEMTLNALALESRRGSLGMISEEEKHWVCIGLMSSFSFSLCLCLILLGRPCLLYVNVWSLGLPAATLQAVIISEGTSSHSQPQSCSSSLPFVSALDPRCCLLRFFITGFTCTTSTLS